MKKNIGKRGVLFTRAAFVRVRANGVGDRSGIPNGCRTDAMRDVFAMRRKRPACASHKPVCADSARTPNASRACRSGRVASPHAVPGARRSGSTDASRASGRRGARIDRTLPSRPAVPWSRTQKTKKAADFRGLPEIELEIGDQWSSSSCSA
ncbi:hypothetical protein [Cognatilysobacter segetis]|uniref:hypothetical protein n=1 Tax=Cognatilysobacter segetis TaxID=2492394 RepID=UPI00105C1A14|nr:hypothetical protein [Lysobacter segetis]